ncbi:MAG: hypothetical protein II635_04230 [Oscillospiraceae bacterium]|nr:hypothetical protein [Oscillospiraceae bacterium]
MITRVLSATGYDFRRWRGNLRVVFTFLLMIVLCFFLSGKVTRFSEMNSSVLQIAEPFIWTFDDANAIMLASMLLILMLGDMPFLGADTPYFLSRMSRREWLTGQVVYIAACALLYCAAVLTVTSLLCMRTSFIGNKWSPTAAMLGFTSAGDAIAVPAFVRTMETTTPYRCMSVIFCLMTCYTLVLVMLMLFMSIRFGKTAAVTSAFGLSLYGYLMNPQLIKTVFNIPESRMYRANLIFGWLSPLNHASYHMHNFGYDKLPAIWQSILIMLGLCALLYLGSLGAIKRYNFNFSKGTGRF